MENKKKITNLKWFLGIGAAACVLAAIILTMTLRNGPSVSERFDAYTEGLFQEAVTANTVNLHYILAYPENYGITDYEISLGEYSPEKLKEGFAETEEMKKDLLSFRRSALTRQQQLTYDILMDYADMELASEDFIFYQELLSPGTGYQSQLPVILAEYTFRSKRDVEDYLALLDLMDEMAEGIIDFEEEKAREGLFMSDSIADTVIEQCREFIADPEDNYMIEVFDDKIDALEGLSEEERQSYREQNRELITTDVVESYQILIDGLESLKGSGTNELGLCYYDKGKEYYQYLIKSGTGLDNSVKQLMIRTEDFIDQTLYGIQMQVAENPELYTAFSEYQFPVMDPEAMLQDLREKAKEDFPEPPAVNYRVKEVHPSMQEQLNPAFYLTIPIDDLQNNVIYVNGKYLGNEDSHMDLYPTMAHEGYPGHLYQNVYTNSCNLPLVRNLFSVTGYSEGWATYVEHEYAYRYAGMGDELAQITSGNAAISLALSAYLDMGIHYAGWSRDEVGEFLAEFGIVDGETTDQLFELIIGDPGTYVNYFAGYMEFLRLRDTARERLGEAFDIKEFHDFLLSTGPAPFYIIEDYMEDYIAEASESAAP